MMIKKLTTMLMAAMMVFALAGIAFSAEVNAAKASLIEDVEYKGKGVVEVDFSKDVKYKKVKVTIKDNNGKKYKSKVLKKDDDDIRFVIKKYKMGRTYSFTIKGVKARSAAKYGSVKGKARINAATSPKAATKPVTTQKPRPAAPAVAVNVEQAKSIALADAGLSADAVFFTKAKLDYDDGRAVYEIEFYYGNTEYEYDIGANSGAIVKKDVEVKNTGKPNRPDPGTPKPVPQNPAASITADMAKNIALADAGLSADAVFFTKEKLDYDDGRAVYEIEFYYGNTEYEYDIDANSGAIVKKDVEVKNTGKPNRPDPGTPKPVPQNPAASITADMAKNIALADAGLNSSQVIMEKVKLDYEHGILVYEVEFKAGYYEYNYDINATDGSIVKKDVEFDD